MMDKHVHFPERNRTDVSTSGAATSVAMSLRQALIRSLGMKPRAVDPYGLVAALAERKANRTALRAQERSDAARKGWETRRAQA